MTPRHNPFRADCIDNLPYLFESKSENKILHSIETLLQNLEEMNRRAAIVGPHGRGKSTLLSSFASTLKARGWNTHELKLDSTNRNLQNGIWRVLPTFGNRDFILLDGAEQLSFWHWQWFLHQTSGAGGVLITSHHKRYLPVLWECQSSPELLHALVVKLSPELLDSTGLSQALFKKHQGNMRSALRELYDLQT